MKCHVCRNPITKETDPAGVIFTRSMVVIDGIAAPANVPVCERCWEIDNHGKLPVRGIWSDDLPGFQTN